MATRRKIANENSILDGLLETPAAPVSAAKEPRGKTAHEIARENGKILAQMRLYEDIHHALKIAASMRGTTMTDCVNDAIATAFPDELEMARKIIAEKRQAQKRGD